MKIFKIVTLSILSIFIVVYLAFLFILPYAIDLNQYSPQITKAIQDNTGFKVNIEGLKVKTAWNLSAGASIEKTDLKYPTGEKFAQINNLEVKLLLLPLVLREIRINSIKIDKIMANIPLTPTLSPKGRGINSSPIHLFNFSPKMPDVSVKNYRVSFVDLANSKNYSIKGSDLKVSDFILNKKIRLKTKGDLIFNGRKQISYNLSLFSKVLVNAQNAKGAQNQKIDIIKIFEDLYKYNLQTNINADLKMSGSPENTKIDGRINLDKITFSFGGKTFPASNLNLAFKGDKVKINSNLYTDINDKATINGFFKNGKHKTIDLKVVSNHTSLANVVMVAKSLLNIVGKRNLDGIAAAGHLKADFKIKSDFKTIQSSGYLKIQNAGVTDKLYNVALNSINADIDFFQDAVNIKKASALLNSQPITLKGTIDKNAIADISVLVENLQLKGILLTSGNAKLLRENDIQGLINVKAYLKGRLDKATPTANVVVSNLNLRNRPSKMQVKLAKAIIDVSANKKSSGKIQVVNLKVIPSSSALISAPSINMSFNNRDLIIQKSNLYLNGIRTNLEGKVSSINSTPRLNSISISIPNQVSVPIEGFPRSGAIVKGGLILSGSVENPSIQGGFSVPLIRIPTMSLIVKNTELNFAKEFSIHCPYIQIANSQMSFNSDISKDFSKGLVLKNANFSSSNLDLDSLMSAMGSLVSNSSSNLGVIITNGKTNIARFKTGNIVATNITSGLSLRDNIICLDNLNADAYVGKVKGEIRYHVLNGKTEVDVQGRGLSANSALTALSGRNNHVNGQLDFDSSISFKGAAEREIMNSLNGDANFIISNGEMGVLGKFEHLLYAQNIVANSVFNATLNVIAKAITLKNTGVYKYLKGQITISSGLANINWIRMSGPSMSLYITGRYYLPENTANLIILGKISDDVVRVLGPIGEFSMDKVLSSIPRIGLITASLVSQYTINPDYENIALIPNLSPKTELPTKNFKVVIDGNVQKQSSVKSFKWLSQPKVDQAPIVSPAKTQIQTIVKDYQDNVKQQYNEAIQQVPIVLPAVIDKLPNLLN